METSSLGEIKSLVCDKNISKLEKNVPSMNSVVPTYLKQVCYFTFSNGSGIHAKYWFYVEEVWAIF